MEAEIRNALERDDFYLGSNQRCVADLKVCGVEALVLMVRMRNSAGAKVVQASSSRSPSAAG